MTDADSKQFATLAAEYALAGHALIKSSAPRARAPYYATRWGWLKPLHSLDEAQQLLEQIKRGPTK